ncbi:MAG TPA: hypothetical protein VEX13_12895 [Chloroflexia bacterium]|nr:hypothetical protein [Chloroflexia bacterium]
MRSPRIHSPGALSIAYHAYFVDVHRSPGEASNVVFRKWIDPAIGARGINTA